MENLGPINVEFLINNREFDRASNKVKDSIKGVTTTADQEAKQIDAIYKNLGAALAGYFSFQAATGFISEIARVRGEFQQLEISLQTILQSKEKADQVLAEAVELAAKTPFNLSDVGAATKQLLAYGFEADNVTDTIRRLGDVSAGLNIPLNDMAYLFGTTRVQGRLFAQDLNQFTNRGIPLISELASQFGVAEQEVKNLVSAGKVGFPDVEKAINRLTSEGGVFFNLMEKQSASITGQISNLGDAWDNMLNKIGQSQESAISEGLEGVTYLVENYQKVIDILEVIAVTYGTYRASLILTSVATKAVAQANAGLTGSQILLNKWTVIATRAQKVLNATMLSNPFVAAATALGLLIAATAKFSKGTKEAVVVSGEFRQAIGDELDKSKELFEALKKTTEGTEARSEAIKLVNKTYNEYLPKQLSEASNLEEIERAQKAVNKAIGESIFLRTQESDLANLREGTANYSQKFGKAVQDIINDAQLSATVGGQLSAEFEKAVNEFTAFSKVPLTQVQAEFDKILREFGIDFTVLGQGGDVSTLNYQDLLRDSQEYAAAMYREKTATNELGEAKTAYLKQLGLFSEEEKQANESTEESITTIKALKEELQALQKAREEIDIKDSSALAQNEAKQVALQQQIAALEIKSIKEREKEASTTELEALEERLTEKEKLYNEYYQAIEVLGKEAADEQFSALRKEGATYVEYLNKALAGVDPSSSSAGRQQLLIRQEIRQASGALSPLDQLKGEIEQMKQVYADFETYKKQFGITAAKEQFSAQIGEFDSYIDYVRQKTLENQGVFTAVMEGRATDQQREAAKLLEKEANEAIRIDNQKYNEQLANLQAYNQERAKLIANYEALRQKLITSGNLKEAQELDRKHQAELGALDDANLDKLKSYQELFEGTISLSKKAVKRSIKDLEDILLNQPMSDARREVELKNLETLKKRLNEIELDDIYKYSQALTGLSESLVSLGESTGNTGIANIGASLSGLSTGVNDVLTMFDDSATQADVVTAGLSGVIRIMDQLSAAAKQRREAEEAYYKSLIGFQQQYNLSLNEQIRLQSILGENVFLSDYEGRIRDGVESLTDANKNYMEAIAELENVYVKEGQKNKIDAGSIGASAAGGAATGAAIGSIVPGLGTAIGAVIGGLAGGIAGLFGGKKKVDDLIPLAESEKFRDLVYETEEGYIAVNKEMADALLQNNLISERSKELVQNVLDWEKAMEEARQQIADVVKELVGGLGGDVRNALVESFEAGENAAIKMGETVEKVLENVVSQILFNSIFSDVFDQLQEDLKGNLAAGDTQGITENLGAFFANAQGLTADFNKALEQAQAAAKKSGFDIFTGDDSSSQTGLAGGIRRDLTEATGTELAGLFRGFYDISNRTLLTVEQQLTVDKQHYDATLTIMRSSAAIEQNTANAVAELKATVEQLKAINKNTKQNSTGYDRGDI